MDKIHKIHLIGSSIYKIYNIPENCNQLQISGRIFENTETHRYPQESKLYLTYEFLRTLKRAKIEILDMRNYEDVMTLADSYDGLFRDLYHLKVVLLPKSLKEMPHFNNCPSLNYVRADGIEIIPERCFVKCPNLAEIKWGNNLKLINSHAFAGTGITHVSLPNNKISIRSNAFQQCEKLYSIVLPDDIEVLDNNAFANCFNLVKVEGGKNIKKISKSTFMGCKKLRYLNFHSSLIDSSFFKLNNSSWDRSDESYSTGRGIVIHEINNNSIIWNIEDQNFYYGEANGLLDKLVEFNIVDDVVISYFEEYVILNRKYKILNITVIENTKSWYPNNLKQSMEYYQKRSFEFSIPFRTFIDKTIDYVNGIDMDKVINDFKTTISEHISTKVGGDDRYHKHTIRRSTIQDSYIDKILPPLDEEFNESGYCTFSYMSEKEMTAIEEDDKKIRQNARELYSKENHIDDIIDNYLKILISANLTIENTIQLSKARCLLKKLLDRHAPYMSIGTDCKVYNSNENEEVEKCNPDFLIEELNDMLR